MSAPDTAAPARVLVVGADEMIVALAEHGLTEAGCHVTIATGNHDAEQQARKAPPRVVVADLVDVASGVQLVRRLRAVGGEAARAGFVFLSLRGTPSDALAELRGEGHDFVSKPFHVDELVARVQAQARRPAATPRDARRFVATLAIAAVLGLSAATAMAVWMPHRGTVTATAPSRPASVSASVSASAAASAASRVTTPTATPAPTPVTTSRPSPEPVPCDDVQARGRAALRLLREPAWTRSVRVSFRPGRAGVLAQSRAATNHVVVYVRSCHDEPLRQVAAAMVDQVAQVRATRWSGATGRAWLRSRGISGASHAQVEQDAGAVAILWQLRSTTWWRSPFPPPRSVSTRLVSLLSS